jgi:hypothetical protein
MELNSISLSDFTKLATVIFEKERASLSQEARESGMFVVEAIPQGTGNTREYTEIDLEEYAANKGQGDQAGRARVQQGYSKTMSSKRVAKDIGITYEMRTQNKYPEVVRRLTNLAQLAVNRLELDLQHRIGFATATSYTDKDGEVVSLTLGDTLALASTAHTLRGSGTTYRNRLAGNPQLSKGALEGMETLVIEHTYNHMGEKVVVPFDILWTTDDPNTVNTAMEYLRSVAAPDFSNSGVKNVYQGKYKHVILSRVATTNVGAVDTTKRKYWGLASSMKSTAHLGIWEEPHLKVPSDLNAGEEFSTDDWNYGVRAGYGIAIVEGSWFKMSTGDGTA